MLQNEVTNFDGDQGVPIELDFKAYEAPESDPFIQRYSAAGYPSSLHSVPQAIEVMRRMSEAEAKGIQLMKKKLKGQLKYTSRTVAKHFTSIPAIIEKYKKPVKMIKIPINELESVTYGNNFRMEVIRETVKTVEDITQLPVPVVTRYEHGWSTIDGQTRISRMKELGAQYVYAYYLPHEQYRDKDLDYQRFNKDIISPEEHRTVKGFVKMLRQRINL